MFNVQKHTSYAQPSKNPDLFQFRFLLVFQSYYAIIIRTFCNY